MLLTLPVREVLPATHRSRIVRLDLQGAQFRYLPGQAVLIAFHGYEPRRPYSMATAPEDAGQNGCLELLVGVDTGGSPGPHLTLQPGALVDVEGPVGRFTFPPDPEERRFIFIAGGTGIAPLRAMMRHALYLPDRHIGVVYSARTPGDFAYEDELRSLARRQLIELKMTVTRDATARPWTGTRGRIGRSELALLVRDPATLCFICGPPALVDEVPKLLDELGIPRRRIKVEEWG